MKLFLSYTYLYSLEINDYLCIIISMENKTNIFISDALSYKTLITNFQAVKLKFKYSNILKSPAFENEHFFTNNT